MSDELSKSILLISPPITKPCEPPAGIARLAGVLTGHGVACRTWDASLDCLLGLVERPLEGADTWTRRALAKRDEHLAGLRSHRLYENRDRYKRAVLDLNRIVSMAGQPHGASISLANYAHKELSPVRSTDLIRAAEQYADNPFYPIFDQRLRELFSQQEPQVIGLSINFMSQALCAFAIIGWIREKLPSTTIVCGGGLVTSWLKMPDWSNPFTGLVDEMICGAGEKRLVELCTAKEVSVSTPPDYRFDAEALPRYLAPTTVLPYSASAGCYWRKCAFCPETAEKSTYQPIPSHTTTRSLSRMTKAIGAGLIHFLDNALSPRLMTQLSDNPPGIPWYGFARISEHLTDLDFVRGLRDSGCVMLKLGVESGDQDVLDALSKGNDINLVSRALKTLHRAGIATYVYLLFGTPAEDEAAAHRTLAFTRVHADCIDFLNLAIFNLPAHSQTAGGLATTDFYDGDLGLYREFEHPKGWTRDRVRRFLSSEFKKPAVIRTIINNDPPLFTSNHAAFFHMIR